MYVDVMKRVILAASSMALLSLGCGHPVMHPSVPPAEIQEKSREQIDVSLPSKDDVEDKSKTSVRMREPGDFVVYRFSGSYRETPVRLTQQVVGYEHGYLLVDVTVDDSGAQQRLRLRIGSKGERKGELISVARFEGAVQVPFGLVAYGQLMNDIVLTADENEGLVDATRTVVDVAGNDLYCDVSSFRVRVGAHDAVMTTVSSDEFAWGHVGGEIATTDGNVLYKAEIVDIGAGSNARVATQEDIEIYEDDYDHFEE
jgi:hypothetical protein